MDFGRLSRWEKVAFWSAIALLGSMFLPWYVIKAQGVALEDVETGEAFTAWQAFELVDLLIFALGAAALALLWVKATSRRLTLPVSLNLALVGLGVVLLAVIGFRAASPPDLGVSEEVLESRGLEVAPVMVLIALIPAALIAVAGLRLITLAGGTISAELATIGPTHEIGEPADGEVKQKQKPKRPKSSGSSARAKETGAQPARSGAAGPSLGKRLEGTPSAIEQRMLPEQLQGSRGRIVAAVSAVVIAAGSIAVWELATGEDETQATAGEGARSLDSILQGSEAGGTTTESGGFFPEEPAGSGGSAGESNAAGAASSDSLLGSWSGPATIRYDDGGSDSFTEGLTISSLEAGQVAGESTATQGDTVCRGPITYHGGTETSARFSYEETNKSECIDASEITVSLRADGSLDYEEVTDKSVSSGTLIQ